MKVWIKGRGISVFRKTLLDFDCVINSYSCLNKWNWKSCILYGDVLCKNTSFFFTIPKLTGNLVSPLALICKLIFAGLNWISQELSACFINPQSEFKLYHKPKNIHANFLIINMFWNWFIIYITLDKRRGDIIWYWKSSLQLTILCNIVGWHMIAL
jgi:hypothetical protein